MSGIRYRLALWVILAVACASLPSAGWAKTSLDERFDGLGAGVTRGAAAKARDDVGRGFSAAVGGHKIPAPEFIEYSLPTVLPDPSRGTIEVRLKRDNGFYYESLFSFVDNGYRTLFTLAIDWQGNLQHRYPELWLFAEKGTPLWSTRLKYFTPGFDNASASPYVSMEKEVKQGQWVTVTMTWGEGQDALYVDGKKIPAETSGPVALPALIAASSKLILGAGTARDKDGTLLGFGPTTSRIAGFRVHDAVIPGGTLSVPTDGPVIASVSDDSFKIPGISGKIVAGDVVNVELTASDNGIATFDMGRVKGISMSPVPVDNGAPGRAPVLPGTYRGSYTIKPGDDFGNDNVPGQIVGQFVSADNVAATPALSSAKWIIETKPIVTFAIDRKDIPADQGTKARIKLTAKDANGNPLKGRNLKLTLSTTDEYTGLVGAGDFGKDVGASVETRWKGATDAWGEVEFDYTSGFAAKTVILQAKDLDSGGVSVDYITSYKEASIDIVLTAPKSLAAARRGLQYSIKVEASRTWLTADGKSRSVIRATVTDPNGSPVAGDAVGFSLSSANGSVRTISGMTDAMGVATAEYIAGKKIGIVVITATDTVRNVSGNVSITLLSDAPAKVILKAKPETLPADGNSRGDIFVKVTDINDNPNKDTKVEFKLSRGAGKLDYADRTTDTFGDAANRFTAGTTPGIATILATVRSRVPNDTELAKAKNVLFVPYNATEETVRIEKWLKKKGDVVARGEGIVEYTVGRDKTIYTLQAPYDLTMGEAFVEYWDNAEVGQTLATVVPMVIPVTP